MKIITCKKREELKLTMPWIEGFRQVSWQWHFCFGEGLNIPKLRLGSGWRLLYSYNDLWFGQFCTRYFTQLLDEAQHFTNCPWQFTQKTNLTDLDIWKPNIQWWKLMYSQVIQSLAFVIPLLLHSCRCDVVEGANPIEMHQPLACLW